jgi:uncharacterized protein (DUF302 family)
MDRVIDVHHISLELDIDFEGFTANLEKSLGRFDQALLANLDSAPADARKQLENAEGEEGLMLFDLQDHGKLLNILGTPKKAKQYVLGNPLIAITMTRHDIRAALYAPLRMLVYEADDHRLRVEYDQPSSLFGQFDNPEITNVAKSLDTKLTNLIKNAQAAPKKAAAY